MTSEPSSMLVFRNGSIGNTLVAVPALRALRQRYPSASLSVVVDRLGFELLEHCPWIDHLIVYDKHGLDRGLVAHIRLVQMLRGLLPSHAVLFKRFFRNGLLAYFSGARVRAGFVKNGRSPFLNMTIPYDQTVNVVDLNLQLAALLGAPATDRRLEIFLTEMDRAQARDVSGTERYIVVHYGGQTASPDFFPPNRFAELLDSLARDDLQVVLVGSGEKELKSAQLLAKKTRASRLAMGLPLRVTAAIIESAALFIGFNSGPAHLAAAASTPGVVFFRPDVNSEAEIRKWAPVSPKISVLVPPASSSDADWQRFMKKAQELARTLLTPAQIAVDE